MSRYTDIAHGSAGIPPLGRTRPIGARMSNRSYIDWDEDRMHGTGPDGTTYCLARYVPTTDDGPRPGEGGFVWYIIAYRPPEIGGVDTLRVTSGAAKKERARYLAERDAEAQCR
jgi:hypothetical protein